MRPKTVLSSPWTALTAVYMQMNGKVTITPWNLLKALSHTGKLALLYDQISDTQYIAPGHVVLIMDECSVASSRRS